VAFGNSFLMDSHSGLEKPPQKRLRLSHSSHRPGGGNQVKEKRGRKEIEEGLVETAVTVEIRNRWPLAIVSWMDFLNGLEKPPQKRLRLSHSFPQV